MDVQMTAEYSRSMKRRNMRPSAIDKRMSEVRGWLSFAGELWVIADEDLVEDYLDTRELGASSRYGAISHLHMFYVWAIRRRLVVEDPTMRIDRPRLPRRLPRPARRVDADAALVEAEPVMAAMLSMMVDAGMRCCEVAVLDWDDVDLVDLKIRVTGKGGHERMVGVPDRLARSLAALDDVEGRVIGRTITACRVSQLVNRYLHERGVRSTAHQLRHLYATRMLAGTGGNLLAVQQALGHASVTSTQIYAQVDPDTALHAARSLL